MLKITKIMTFFIFLIAMTLSANTEITFQQGKNITLVIPCINGGNLCDSFMNCNMTITRNIDGSYIVDNQPLTFVGNGNFEYNLTFPYIGEHIVKLYCADGDVFGTALFSIKITYNGSYDPTGNGIIIVGLILSFIAAGILLYISLTVNTKDKFTDDGFVLEINYIKYLQIGALFGSYLSFLLFTFLLWQTALNFTIFEGLTNITYTLFMITMTLGIPIFFIILGMTLIAIMNNKALRKLKERGLRKR